MSRYIDADAIHIPKMETGLDDTKMRCAIANAPTVDVVPVVRCKDCVYWNEREVNKNGFVVCKASHMDCTEYDYCSFGEKVTE